MANEGLQPEEFEAAESEQPAPGPEPAGFDAYRSIVRLLIGLALVGGDDLTRRLRAWETARVPEPLELSGEAETASASDLARRALIGMIFEAAETSRQLVWGAAGLSASFAGALWSAFRPVADSFVFRPLWAPIRAAVTRGESRFERYSRIGRDEEQRSRRLAGEVTGLIIEDAVNYIGDNPGVRALVDAQVERLLPRLVADAAIQTLIREQAGAYIGYLATRPESLDPLVREVGDRYIAYLNEHPEAVQNLVQGQAVGMATEIRDDVRTITVTGDTFLETLARALLRRTPREELPPPPPEVRRRAVQARRRAAPGVLTDDVRYLKEV